MATLADVNQASNQQAQSNAKEQSIVNIAQEGSVSAETDYVIFKLVNTKRKGRLYIDGTDDVVNPTTGKVERVRLLSGIDTIWQKEQKDVDKEYINRNKRSLIFEGKICRIFKHDTTALEFARLCNHFIENPKRKSGSKFEFFEYNPAKQAQEALKKEMLELDMAIKAKELPIEQVKRLASFVGISFVDELAQPKPDDAVRSELMLYAKRNPFDFQKLIDSKEVDVAYLVRKAIVENKIDLGQPNAAYYASGGLITKLPPGAKAMKFLTDFALNNTDEGADFLARLQKL